MQPATCAVIIRDGTRGPPEALHALRWRGAEGEHPGCWSARILIACHTRGPSMACWAWRWAWRWWKRWTDCACLSALKWWDFLKKKVCASAYRLSGAARWRV